MEAIYEKFVNMCQTGNWEQIQEMVKENPDIESKLYDGLAFSFAAFGGNLDVVKYLVETCQMDVNVDKGLPLCNASGFGDLGVVKYLIEKCGVAVCDEPLLYAANKHHKDVVKYLLSQGASFSDFQSIEPPKSEAYCLKAEDYCQKMIKEIKLGKMKEAEELFQRNLKMLKKAKNTKRSIRRRPKRNIKNGNLS